MFTTEDRTIIRDLAKKVAEIADMPIGQRNAILCCLGGLLKHIERHKRVEIPIRRFSLNAYILQIIKIDPSQRIKAAAVINRAPIHSVTELNRLAFFFEHIFDRLASRFSYRENHFYLDGPAPIIIPDM